jgi:hypothetical protein
MQRSMTRRALRILLATLVLAGALTGSALAQPNGSVSQSPIAAVAIAASVDIRCYSDMSTYFGDAQVAPERYWLGIAGFWGVPQSAWTSADAAPVVGLTANTCLAASRLRDGVTVARAYAAFTVAHELAHASGIPDETLADCRGAALLPQVAVQLGLHGAKALTQLEQAARLSSGYNAIPASCWAAGFSS